MIVMVLGRFHVDERSHQRLFVALSYWCLHPYSWGHLQLANCFYRFVIECAPLFASLAVASRCWYAFSVWSSSPQDYFGVEHFLLTGF